MVAPRRGGENRGRDPCLVLGLVLSALKPGGLARLGNRILQPTTPKTRWNRLDLAGAERVCSAHCTPRIGIQLQHQIASMVEREQTLADAPDFAMLRSRVGVPLCCHRPPPTPNLIPPSGGLSDRASIVIHAVPNGSMFLPSSRPPSTSKMQENPATFTNSP